MTAATGPDAPMLIPLGQPLGRVVQADGDARYHVRLGAEVYRLEMAQAAVWLQLHAARPGTVRVDSTLNLDVLIDLGLVTEVAIGSAAARDAFGRSYRLLPLQTCVGSSKDAPDVFVLIAGDQRTVGVDAVMRQVLAAGPSEGSLARSCNIISGGLSVVPGTAALGSPDALIEYVLGRIHGPLSVHGCYIDQAIEPFGADSSADRCAAVQTKDGDRAEYGTYGVGYLTGTRYGRFGLTGIDVRLGREMLTLPDLDSLLTWMLAHGFDQDGAIVDDTEQIVATASQGGVQMVPRHLRHLSGLGLIQQPDGAEVVEMAATHRLEPLLAGIGMMGNDPSTFYLGVNADQIAVSLTAEEYVLWRTAHLSESLLEAAQKVGQADTVDDLVSYLRLVQVLTVKRAAYLDRVRTP